MREITRLIVHCSATKPSMDIGRAEIDDWHRQRGWSQIGYHFVIRRNGDIEMGRPVAKIGAHVRGYNTKSIGICIVGGVSEHGNPENNFTAPQFESLQLLLIGLASEYQVSPDRMMGHRDLSPDLNDDGEITENEWMKACPSFDVRGWVDLWWE